MQLSPLTAISPIDGRYRSKCETLDNYFSEYALIKYRVRVEIEYFIALSDLNLDRFTPLSHDARQQLRDIYNNFSVQDAQEVKDIESTTNHDVKAVEYFIKRRLDNIGLAPLKEYIHFGLTSQDINNTAVPMSLADALRHVVIPQIQQLIDTLQNLADQWADIPMLAKTHGQPASPTRLGKEIMVYVYRLTQQLDALRTTPMTGKFGGATGNFNAHHVAYPHIDWPEFANMFLLQHLGIQREQYTTQISNYDNLAATFDALHRIATIIIDLDRDMWMYISMNYFRQKIRAGEVGSSAMPHKVNPIDFENSEGNLGIAGAILSHLSAKLPISRLQRDLTDSTVIRNIGTPLAHILIAIASTQKGLGKLILNQAAIEADLEQNWAVVAEAIQTILRRHGYPNPYETLKQLTRTNQAITADTIAQFIDTLNIPDDLRATLHTITPHNYTGM